MRQHVVLFCFILFAVGILPAQNGCPGCIICLPSDLSADTMYLSAIPPGVKGVPYDKSFSFRLPKDMSEVAPAWVGPITQIEIMSITGLPEYLKWEANDLAYIPAAYPDGCVRICGTPDTSGSFNLAINLRFNAMLWGVIPNTGTFQLTRTLDIDPPFSMTNSTGCGSTTVTFTNNIPFDSLPGFLFFWDFGDGTFFTGKNPPPHTYNEPGTYEVWHSLSSDSSGHWIVVNTNTQTVTVHPLPLIPDIVVNPIPACMGSNVVLTSSYVSGNQWVIDRDTIPGATDSLLTTNSSGYYEVRVTDVNGCTAVSEAVWIEFLHLPVADFQIGAIQLDSLSVTLSNQSLNGQIYIWHFGDGQTDTTGTLQDIMHIYAQSGTYTITLTVQNECGMSMMEKTVGLVGTEMPAWLRVLRLYPNPNNGHFILEMSGAAPGQVELALFHPYGHLVYRQIAETEGDGALVRKFDLGGLPPALYRLHIRTGAGVAVVNVLVQR
ncbi:MAG: PKD domain-containing protein [Saprospiraceae bacterium]|nr:PKD domain-containing protein [Saprospiraceae bacterium]